MADPVTDARNDLIAKLKTVGAISESSVTLYTQEELLDVKKKLGYPAAGVVYVGMQATANQGKSVVMVFDVYLIGNELCKGMEESETTKMLDDMRNAIKCTSLPRVGVARKWEFIFETPHAFKEDVLAYVQRWRIPAVMTN